MRPAYYAGSMYVRTWRKSGPQYTRVFAFSKPCQYSLLYGITK